MESTERELLLVELKYCERCGGLWLRVAGSDEPFCASCAVAMREFPAPRGRRNRPRPRNEGRIEGLTEFEASVDFFGEGATT